MYILDIYINEGGHKFINNKSDKTLQPWVYEDMVSFNGWRKLIQQIVPIQLKLNNMNSDELTKHMDTVASQPFHQLVSIQLFKKIMKNMYNKLIKKYPELIKKKHHARKINDISPDTNIYIIGDIHGSVIAFFETIERFVEDGIINDDLRIMEKNIIIFTGDLIDYSLYSIEMLALFYVLYSKNIDRILCTKGNHENFETYTSNLIYPLEMESKYQFDLVNLKKDFFRVLDHNLFPDVLYIKYKNDDKYFHFSHGGFPHKYIDDDTIKNFLNSSNNVLFFDKKTDRHSFQWADFDLEISDSTKYRPLLNTTDVKRYLEKHNIICIISGHQDIIPIAILPDSPPIREEWNNKSLYYNLYTVLDSTGKHFSKNTPVKDTTTNYRLIPGKDFLALVTSAAKSSKTNVGSVTYLKLHQQSPTIDYYHKYTKYKQKYKNLKNK